MRHYADKQDRPKQWHFDVHSLTDAGNSQPIRFKAACHSQAEVVRIGQAVSRAYGNVPWYARAEGEDLVKG